ncbi:MAG TPA: DUF2231 domain-containing protein [Candidatus Lustribacter sp.]|nr:DUF2231 domain-containing protein [Candidatus Lustribacter sp.]
MFGSIGGLPIHALVIHVVVILAPLSALLALAYALAPRWRRTLRWPTALGALVTGVSGVVAGESGKWLDERVIASIVPTDPTVAAHLKALGEHVAAGERLEKVCVAFMIVMLATVFWAAPAPAAERGDAPASGARTVDTVARVVVVLLALLLIALTIQTGHLGATAVWGTLLTTS